MKAVYIIKAVRTPLGSFGGKLLGFPATELGALAIAGALGKAGIDKNLVEEVIMGNVCSANLGQAPARQAALKAGLRSEVNCTTVNKVCSSGIKAVMYGAQSIIMGHAGIVVAGGMESMSNIPYYVTGARWGLKYGNGQLIDGLAKDGLTDAYDGSAMGICADHTAHKYHISREAQDEFAIRSYKFSEAATNSGAFKAEIIPIGIPQRKGDHLLLDEDEEYRNVNFDRMLTLKPAITPDGTVTAANASTINDGAAALILASEEKVKEHNLTPFARIVSWADAEQDPQWFATSPTLAAPLALKRAGMVMNDMDFVEINEAFAVVALAFNKILDVNPDIVNVHGGAVSLGHPLGASGARILTTLSHVLDQKNGKYGLAAICNGGGGASAMVLEKV